MPDPEPQVRFRWQDRTAMTDVELRSLLAQIVNLINPARKKAAREAARRWRASNHLPPKDERTMLQEFTSKNDVDNNGNPTGGVVSGNGLSILWQNGPLGRGEERTEPNGAFVETVIAAARQRIDFYQTASDGRFACDENAQAIMYLDHALEALNARTERREAAGVEGTHEA